MMRTQSLAGANALALTDDAMFDRIKHGSSNMPSFGHELSDEQIRALVRHIREDVQKR
jgi:mono/diheme cytochrome c family protein